ncbi:MAG: copper amine oxidase N-terminal domain-containing protein [Caldisericia bacterium]|nr:copper amine oxidase N-terminal domain-containing protein [Caldisericia bacterium]
MKARTNKVLSVILSVVLLGSIFSVFKAEPVSALKNFVMTVQPRKVATRSTYKFNVTIEKRLKVHEAVTLVWPAGTIIDPPIPKDEKKKKERLTQIIESMSIGLSPCSACQGLPKITTTPDGGIQLVFNTHIELNPEIEGYSNIVVTVPDTCGFVTPPEQGEYMWRFSTGAEPTLVSSAPFMIVTSAIGVPEGMPEVEVKPSSFRANASYKIGFNVGQGGWLREGDGRIRVKFPEGTLFSKKEIKEKYILVNGKPLVNPPLAVRTQMTFITPVGVADGGRIVIEISEGAGVVNPSKPGEYTLQVSTIPADKEWVESIPYLIEKGGALLKIVPAKVNKNAQYSFSFILEPGKSLAPSGKINVKFPEGTVVPTSLDKTKITIGGKPVSSIAVKGMEVELNSAVSVEEEDAVDVVFGSETGIMNSKKAGEVKLGYKLESDKDYLLTSPVELIESRLEIEDVMNDPNNAHSISEWTIDGMVGDNGALKKGDFIAITFPENVEIPEKISAETITINEETVSKVTVKGQTIEISLSESISGGEIFKLVVTLDAGIRNPNEEKVGYTLSVYTSVEKNPVLTPTFFTTPALPEAKYKISGGEKGEDGWYLNPPVVNFFCDDPTAVIKLYWDDKDNQIITFGGDAKPLDIGQYESRITYWAESITGVEPPKSFVVKVDTVLPEVVMSSPEELKTITTEATIKVEGRTTLIATIRFGVDSLEYDLIAFINGENVVVNPEDGTFSKMVDLKNGLNKIEVLAKDEAGHKKILNYEVMFDIEPPEIDVTYPKEGEVVTKKRFEVTGKTDPTAQLTIDGEFVYLEEDGSFAYEMTPRKLGKLTIELIATDPVGNVTAKKTNFTFGYTIILAIGKKTATVNGEVQDLSMTPIIQNGRTLVPFGFIARALNAEVGFTKHPITKNVDTVSLELDGTKVILTIGSKIAKVNGKDMEMDIACQIISSNTMVPVRFVTDSLGAEIGWEGKSQTITITYPKVR